MSKLFRRQRVSQAALDALNNEDDYRKTLAEEVEQLKQQIGDNPRSRAEAIKELFDTMAREMEPEKLREQREQLASLIKEGVEAISIKIFPQSRYAKAAKVLIKFRDIDRPKQVEILSDSEKVMAWREDEKVGKLIPHPLGENQKKPMK